VGAILAVLLVGVAGSAYAFWPHYRPTLAAGETYGIDVSSHQGVIDWDAVAADGIEAAYIKASEGGAFRDSRFIGNWRGATQAGLRVGAYHFFTLCRDGDEQAGNLLQAMAQVSSPGSRTSLPPVVDLELGGNCADRPPVEVVSARLVDFVSRVEAATGQRVLIYVADSYETRYPLPPSITRDRWVRRIGLRPDGPWVWWQVHAGASVEGISTPVDLDVIHADPPG